MASPEDREDRDAETIWKAKWFKLFETASLSEKHLEQIEKTTLRSLEIFKLKIKNYLTSIKGLKSKAKSQEEINKDFEKRLSQVESEKKNTMNIIAIIIAIIAALGAWSNKF